MRPHRPEPKRLDVILTLQDRQLHGSSLKTAGSICKEPLELSSFSSVFHVSLKHLLTG